MSTGDHERQGPDDPPLRLLCADEQEAVMASARQRMFAALEALSGSDAVHTGQSEETLAAHFAGVDIPEEPGSFERYSEFLVQALLQHSVNMASPRCLGHMTGAVPEFVTLLSEVMVRLNQNLVKCEASRAAARLERQTLAMLHRAVFGCPPAYYCGHLARSSTAPGLVTSGGTLANLTALWCARNLLFRPDGEGPGVEAEGVAAALRRRGFERAVILGSSRMHYSVEKAAGVLGLGTESVVKVPVDADNRTDPGALADALAMCRTRRWGIVAVVAVAGATDCGSIDPIDEIADVAEREQVHLHVDAAWTTPLLFSARHRPALAGIERANSVTLDGHKQLGLPIGIAVLLLRSPHAVRVLEKEAGYMLRKNSGDPGKHSIEGSRPAMALLLHAALHVIGARGYARMVEDNISKAQAMARMIEESEAFELLARPQTNIVLYRYVPEPLRAALGRLSAEQNERVNDCNEELQRIQYEAGRTFVARTTLTDLKRYRNLPVVALRAVIGNARTREEDIRAVLSDQLAIAAGFDSVASRSRAEA